MGNPEKLATLGTQDTGRRQTKQKTQHRKLQKMSNTNTTKNRKRTQASAKGRQFFLLIRQSPCYSYSQYVLDTTLRKQKQIT